MKYIKLYSKIHFHTLSLFRALLARDPKRSKVVGALAESCRRKNTKLDCRDMRREARQNVEV